MAEFVDALYANVKLFLQAHVVPAVTVEHILAVSIALLEHVAAREAGRRVAERSVSWQQINRLGTLYPQLNDTIVMSLSDDDLSVASVSPESVASVGAMVEELYVEL